MYDGQSMDLKRVNNVLVIAIVMVNTYVIAGPLLPKLTFWWQARQNRVWQLEQKAKAPVPVPVAPQASAAYQPNELIIPSMLLDQPILEGPQKDMYKILDRGIWHWPLSSTPDKGSNTVLLGHRFTYTNPTGVLYHLDKVRIGDTIGLVWDSKKYVYTVSRVQTVAPNMTSVVASTINPTLTVYTCTPLWAPHNRLVVTAQLEATP